VVGKLTAAQMAGATNVSAASAGVTGGGDIIFYQSKTSGGARGNPTQGIVRRRVASPGPAFLGLSGVHRLPNAQSQG
jgi:hypothetical protein